LAVTLGIVLADVLKVWVAFMYEVTINVLEDFLKRNKK
jgi:hypothetical protein